MNEQLAFCENKMCRRIFQVLPPIGGNKLTNIAYAEFTIGRGNTSICPSCNGEALISEGTYKYSNGNVYLIDGPKKTKAILAGVKHLLPEIDEDQRIENNEDRIFVKCDNHECNAIVSAVSFLGNKSSNIYKIELGSSGQGYGLCEMCNKGNLRILSGIYAADSNGTSLLSGPPETLAIIDRVNKLINSFKQDELNKKEVIAELELVSPAIAEISRQTSDKFTYKDWINLITALLGLFVAIQQAYFKKEDKPVEANGVKPEYVQMLIRENNELRATQKANKKATDIPIPVSINQSIPVTQQHQSAPRAGRNQLCPCGSGKKFKRCHGFSTR